MTNSNDFKVGVTIEVDGSIYTILVQEAGMNVRNNIYISQKKNGQVL